MAYNYVAKKSRKASKSKRSKKGGSRMHKLVPWGLVLANQLFSRKSRNAGKRMTRKRRKSSRRRRR